MRACGHVVLRQNATLWFHEARVGLCFTKRKERLAHHAQDALMCGEHAGWNTEINNGKVASATGWKQSL